MLTTTRRTAKILVAAAAIPASLLLAATAAAASPARIGSAPSDHPAGSLHFHVRQILNGMNLRHSFIPAGSHTRKSEPLADPDDITVLGRSLYTGFQNGVGPQGQPSTSGNTDSTIVQFTATGKVTRQWDIKGKCDGLTADPRRHLLIATVNEDANSSIYTITPGARRSMQIQHYRYNRPLPHQGGTDAISIYHGKVLVSASAPGTTGKPAPQPSYPAVCVVTFQRRTHIAKISPLFYDEARATVANFGRNHGKVVRLALTDPDSNEIVPRSGPRFGGDFMLTSQGDKEQIFVQRGKAGGKHGIRLAVLRLSQSVDDTAWARSSFGRLYGSSTSLDTVDVVTGPFLPSMALVAVTPCDANNAPATCPGPGFPPNYLGAVNDFTGHIVRVPVRGATYRPQGMVFVSLRFSTPAG